MGKEASSSDCSLVVLGKYRWSVRTFRKERGMIYKRALAVVAAALSIGMMGGAQAGATPDTLIIEGFVQDQMCMGGDRVRVTLSATVESTSQFVTRWDTNGDGRFDTRASQNPTIMVTYPDEVNRTVTIGGRNREGNTDRDTFSFATLRCEG